MLANEHGTLRKFLGHSDWTGKSECRRQTLKDNLRLFTPELLEEVNQAMVDAGDSAAAIPKLGFPVWH